MKSIIINSFRGFKTWVKKQGGDWLTSGVYFHQTREWYVAYYMPNYPDMSPDDKTIMYNHIKKKFQNNS